MNILKDDFCIKIITADRSEYFKEVSKIYDKFSNVYPGMQSKSSIQYDFYDPHDRHTTFYYGFKDGSAKVAKKSWHSVITLEHYKKQVNNIINNKKVNFNMIDHYSII